MTVDVGLTVNGAHHDLKVDTRTTLLDLLREQLGLTGTKKGCDHGQCGACTVLIDGVRKNACLNLAASCEGREVVTIEGLANGSLHPMQAAFVKHDGFQCGYCTPGQICSAVGMLAELKRGLPSAVTDDLKRRVMALAENEVRERMSGNICRCAAYPNIVAAILDAAGRA
jgi:xanthine dehydrogenase YagT iron-sulfur-binding subunit